MSTKRLHVSLPGLPKVGFYISLLLLPGGFIGLLLVCWLERRAGSKRPEGTTRMWYSQMLGWRDLLPGLWRLARSEPRLKADIGGKVSSQSSEEPAARYLRACALRA